MLSGVIAVVFGSPGTGKTPLCNTAPRPVLCSIEPGLLSMRGSTVPTFIADTVDKIDDFMKWVVYSNETANFDTICIDSISHMAEVYLKYELTKNKDGRAAYGKMSTRVFDHLYAIYRLKQKHAYLIAKQSKDDQKARPYFPGQELNTTVPHLFDVIMQIGTHNIPNTGQYKAFRTADSYDAVARDRSGRLSEYEPCDLTALFNKAMS